MDGQANTASRECHISTLAVYWEPEPWVAPVSANKLREPRVSVELSARAKTNQELKRSANTDISLPDMVATCAAALGPMAKCAAQAAVCGRRISSGGG